MFKILLAEDDKNLRELIATQLASFGYEVKETENGEEAYNAFLSEHFDLLVTDILMPKVDGDLLVKNIKREKKDFPVIMLTALDQIEDKEKSFENGADDYMTKPVDYKELKLRIQALLRRYNVVNEKTITHKRIKLDYIMLRATVDNIERDLTKKEFMLLYKLVSAPGRIFSRDQLLNEIWGFDSYSIERTVDVHINKIRDKLDCSDIEIQSVRGLGYRVVLK